VGFLYDAVAVLFPCFSIYFNNVDKIENDYKRVEDPSEFPELFNFFNPYEYSQIKCFTERNCISSLPELKYNVDKISI